MRSFIGILFATFSLVALAWPGVAQAKEACEPGLEKSGLICYKPCKDGYKGVGPVCWQRCPEGFRDDGAFCAKPAPYGRGVGYPWKFGDKPFNLDKAKRRCERDHGDGRCHQSGLIYYPKCREGFHNVGCCVCSPNCPSGMKDIGVSCAKPSYGRGVGRPLLAVLEWWRGVEKQFERLGELIKEGAEKFAEGWKKFWREVEHKLKEAGEWVWRQMLKGIYRLLSGRALHTAQEMERKGLPKQHALVVCIENNNKHALLDSVLEGFSVEQMGFYARRYAHRAIVRECSADKLRAALKGFKDQETDVAILAHGSDGSISLNGGSIDRDWIRKLRDVNQRIRAVFQLNCWGYTTADAWLEAGARGVSGTRKINYRVVAYNNFFAKWILGETFKKSVARCNRVDGLVSAIARIAEYFAKKYGDKKADIDSHFRAKTKGGLDPVF